MQDILKQLTTTGVEIVTDEEHNKRLDICYSCDKHLENRCSICGCDIRFMSGSKIGACPINKW